MPVHYGIESDMSLGEIEVNQGGDPTIGRSTARDVNPVQAIEDYTQKQTQIQTLQFPLDRPKFYFVMSFHEYSRSDLMSVNASLNMTNSIILPMPMGIEDMHSVDYDEKPMGTVLGTTVNAAYGGVKNALSNSKGLTETMGALAGAAGQAAGPAAIAVGAEAINESPFGSAAKAMFGYSPNEFFTVLLSGPRYKRHQLTWRLIPHNFAESEAIRQIIKSINNNMAVRYGASGGALWGFPSVVRCAFIPNYRYLYRFKPSVIADFMINYTPMSQPSFYHASPYGTPNDLPPESVELTIMFQEMEYWLAGDFKDGGAPDDTTGPRQPTLGIENAFSASVESINQRINQVWDQGKVIVEKAAGPTE